MPQKDNQSKQLSFKKTLMFSLEFGLMIALPLVLFAFLGNKLAAHYNNRAFLFAGLILALLISCVWFYKRINDIYNDFTK